MKYLCFLLLVGLVGAANYCYSTRGRTVRSGNPVNKTDDCNFDRNEACYIFVVENNQTEVVVYGCGQADGNELPAECGNVNDTKSIPGHHGALFGQIHCCQSEKCNKPLEKKETTTTIAPVVKKNFWKSFGNWFVADYLRIPLIAVGVLLVGTLILLLIGLGVLSNHVNDMKDILDEHTYECELRFKAMELKSKKEVYNYVDKMARNCVKKTERKAGIESKSSSRQSKSSKKPGRSVGGLEMPSYFNCFSKFGYQPTPKLNSTKSGSSSHP
ncbi:hypothetical protein M3Y98_00461300 [Aphelenchoides besseyi]|nr:hypothetical protein M3Y98_00461300 [Aphelenchoides besseyi]KAI6207494.1 hypothetical protein M3Y96_00014700 [Aphelenchoides besseyi]